MNKKLYDNLQDGIEERGVTPEMAIGWVVSKLSNISKMVNV